MKYLYYPGCSLKSTGRAYEESLLAVFRKLGIELAELDDWNCCGATNYMSINEIRAISVTSRNLALAEKMNGTGDVQLVVPCNACYMGLMKTQTYLDQDAALRNSVMTAMQDAGLGYEGRVKIRHPLDVLINDLGMEKLSSSVVKPLSGLKVASYYGCQLVRPIAAFDDIRDPQSLDEVVRTMGGTSLDWPLKLRCCGGSMTSTVTDVGLRLNFLILKEAKKRGADMIVTACPLCQFNLECFQKKISRKFKEDVSIPVLFFSQLMGIALGIGNKELGMQRLFVKPSIA